MNCPTCNRRARVIDTRPRDNYRTRRYLCRCGERFTTRETRWVTIDDNTEDAKK